MKLNYKNTLLVGLAFLTISAFWQLYDFIVPLLLKNTFHVNDTLAGFIMSLDNIVALFMLPFFGMLSDKTHSRLGRRIPYVIGGTIAAAVFMMLIPYAAHTQQLVLFMIALGAVLIAMSTYRSPAVALMPDITPKPLRSKGNAVINLMGALGGAAILLVTAFLAPNTKDPSTANYWPIFGLTAGIMLIGTMILVLTVNEHKLVQKMHDDSTAAGLDADQPEIAPGEKHKLPGDVKKSMALILASIALWFMGYNAITSAFSKYAVNQLGIKESQASLILMVAVITATIAFLPIGILSSKIGRKKSIMGGIVLLALVFGTAAFYTAYTPLMFVSFGLAGIGWAAINVNSLPMVLEMSKDADVGKYTGYYYTFSMAAQVVTPILSGFLLEHVGYYTLLPYGAFFIALAFFTMMAVKHGDAKAPKLESKLEAFDSID